MFTSVHHFSEEDLCKLRGKSDIGVISITEPDRYVQDLDDSKWASVIRLYFHDLSRPWQNYVLFTREQASQILSWLEENEETLSAVYVHCWAGISRSAPVARFIAHWWGLEYHNCGSFYNTLVYDTLRNEAIIQNFIPRAEIGTSW